MRTLLVGAIVIALHLVSSSTLVAADLNILFLGDLGHHQPARRFDQIHPVLAARGIDLSYTEDLVTALQPAALDKFDGLLVYANIDKIEDNQATALLDYVARGKGFIPLHCASYCFRNNDDVVALIGAQFQKHGTGVFRTVLSDAGKTHPLLKNFQSFESWDETYVHVKHNERDRTVLEYRVDDAGREPWTWVRTHGKGRVFYTAWGHDERTWSHAGFQNLVERGIRWACGANEINVPAYADRPAMKPKRTDVKPFEYVEANLPFYSPTGKRTGNDKPVTRLQKPLPPEESLKHFVTPEGFHVELFAAEPDIGKPLSMAWDERGRLWLCESVDYPNDLQPPGQGHDRIRICEDTNGDGRADRFTIFAEQLSIPTAIAFWRGGAIVQDGTQTIFLKDTNGDDRADVRETLITGWGMGDTHGGVSNFQYGLDNWIWAMQGYNQSTPEFNGQKAQTFRQGFFRFKLSQSDPPKVTDLEFIRSTNNNTWGLGISEEGLIFGSTANGNPSEFMPIPNRYYERVRGWSAEVLRGIAESNQF
ncbi:MAG: ThuA domain-containing protein, partial [Planctomycetaceae bacterium]|nr:ThuA domain-containing protein [Planctomycetaceae bacterium]